MGRYRERTVVEAVQYDGTFPLEFLTGDETVRAGTGGAVELVCSDHLIVPVWPGDWIIRGRWGDVWTCDADTFAAHYEPADASPDPMGSPAEVGRG